MPFREQEYKERCGICGEEADAHCPRCEQNTCAKHRVKDLLCQPCEDEYRRLEAREIAGDPPESAWVFPVLVAAIVLYLLVSVAVLVVRALSGASESSLESSGNWPFLGLVAVFLVVIVLTTKGRRLKRARRSLRASFIASTPSKP